MLRLLQLGRTWKPLYGSDFYVNKSLIRGPHYVTTVAAPALEHDTRANAWHRESAVRVRKKSMAVEAQLECYNKLQQALLCCIFIIMSA